MPGAAFYPLPSFLPPHLVLPPRLQDARFCSLFLFLDYLPQLATFEFSSTTSAMFPLSRAYRRHLILTLSPLLGFSFSFLQTGECVLPSLASIVRGQIIREIGVRIHDGRYFKISDFFAGRVSIVNLLPLRLITGTQYSSGSNIGRKGGSRARTHTS